MNDVKMKLRACVLLQDVCQAVGWLFNRMKWLGKLFSGCLWVVWIMG
ncbi:hypothetical protein [Kingella oralis]